MHHLKDAVHTKYTSKAQPLPTVTPNLKRHSHDPIRNSLIPQTIHKHPKKGLPSQPLPGPYKQASTVTLSSMARCPPFDPSAGKWTRGIEPSTAKAGEQGSGQLSIARSGDRQPPVFTLFLALSMGKDYDPVDVDAGKSVQGFRAAWSGTEAKEVLHSRRICSVKARIGQIGIIIGSVRRCLGRWCDCCHRGQWCARHKRQLYSTSSIYYARHLPSDANPSHHQLKARVIPRKRRRKTN
ncbi:hypothetical protein V8C44DRAFT_328511 [Trichoderma aethiopicum]